MTRIAITAGATAGNGRRAATHYGPRGIEDVIGSQHADVNDLSTLTTTFSFDDLPVVGLDALIPRIPGNAKIVSATFRVLEAFVGGTSLTLGLNEPDGTVVDADGIDAAILTAVINVVGETVLCDGDLVTTLDGIGTEDLQLIATTAGTYTAGKGVLEIVYTALYDRAAS